MRFSERLKFFVFGGCFVALGVVLTHFTGIEAGETDLVGEIKQFDTIVCKNLSIADDDGNTRILLSLRDEPAILMLNSEGKVIFMASIIERPGLMIGEPEGDNMLIDTNSIMRSENGNPVSRWR